MTSGFSCQCFPGCKEVPSELGGCSGAFGPLEAVKARLLSLPLRGHPGAGLVPWDAAGSGQHMGKPTKLAAPQESREVFHIYIFLLAKI